MGTVRTTLLAKICAMSVLAAARQGVDNRISAFALSLPIDEYYVQGCSIMDINSDRIPEVYLTAASGWQYYVYYELDGELREVEDMEAWAWTSRLLCTSDEKLIMYTYPHTVGTEGNLNYRVWQWGENGYFLEEDLWRLPIEWEWDGKGSLDDFLDHATTEYVYLSSDKAIDPFNDNFPYDDLLIMQEEFEWRTAGFDEAEIVLDPLTIWEDDSILYWSDEWWDQYTELDEWDKAIAAIKEEIAKELLHWNQ